MTMAAPTLCESGHCFYLLKPCHPCGGYCVSMGSMASKLHVAAHRFLAYTPIYARNDMRGLVTENFLSAQALDGTELLDGLHVKFLFVAKDDVTVGLVGHLFLLKLHDVLQGDVG